MRDVARGRLAARMEEIAHEAGGGTFKVQFKAGERATGPPNHGDVSTRNLREERRGQIRRRRTVQRPGRNAKNTAAVLESGRRDMMDMMKTIVTVMGNKSGPNYSEIAALGEIFAIKGTSRLRPMFF